MQPDPVREELYKVEHRVADLAQVGSAMRAVSQLTRADVQGSPPVVEGVERTDLAALFGVFADMVQGTVTGLDQAVRSVARAPRTRSAGRSAG